jgi:hypothetical protein
VPGGRDLNQKSISIDAEHEEGYKEFEVHSLYGFYGLQPYLVNIFCIKNINFSLKQQSAIMRF